MRLLFICSRNKWRGPTAARIYARQPGVYTRSAGTSASSHRRINERLLLWADIILFMEHHHFEIVTEDHRELMKTRHSVVLNIEDSLHYEEEKLTTQIKAKADPIVMKYLPEDIIKDYPIWNRDRSIIGWRVAEEGP